MKKILTIIFLITLILPSYAGGVGYINYDKVINEYQFAKNSLREIETKANEIEKYLEAKEEEFSKLDSPVQKKKLETTVRNEMKTKETAFNDFRSKREEAVYNKIHAVSEKIRMEKGFDAILDAGSVFSGGVDITDELIKKLNSSSQ
jgi:Skp family chaperone for outer membrane proteins